jgi:hypothetical protein
MSPIQLAHKDVGPAPTAVASADRCGGHVRPPCGHTPRCPAVDAVDHAAARIVAFHPEQGWSLLCNGVILFDDDGELLPDGQAVQPRRPSTRLAATA